MVMVNDSLAVRRVRLFAEVTCSGTSACCLFFSGWVEWHAITEINIGFTNNLKIVILYKQTLDMILNKE
jgi:hypothetical protein